MDFSKSIRRALFQLAHADAIGLMRCYISSVTGLFCLLASISVLFVLALLPLDYRTMSEPVNRYLIEEDHSLVRWHNNGTIISCISVSCYFLCYSPLKLSFRPFPNRVRQSRNKTLLPKQGAVRRGNCRRRALISALLSSPDPSLH